MLLTTALVGCAMTGEYARDPNGQPVYYIDSMSAWVAHRTADSMCPSGYNIVGDALQTIPLDYDDRRMQAVKRRREERSR